LDGELVARPLVSSSIPARVLIEARSRQNKFL
jgi:hypothetical protein